MSTNRNGTLRVSEFCMFVNGPFATNIHVDLSQFEGEANKEFFTEEESRILKFIQDKSKSVTKIAKQAKLGQERVIALLNNLKERKLVEQEEMVGKMLFSHGES